MVGGGSEGDSGVFCLIHVVTAIRSARPSYGDTRGEVRMWKLRTQLTIPS